MKSMIAAASALLLCTGFAYAQDSQSGTQTSASNSSSNSPNPSVKDIPMRQQVKDSLQKDGFQDITVDAASFIVHAKDKNGHPTAMVIGPDSTFVVTDLDSKGSSTQSNQPH